RSAMARRAARQRRAGRRLRRAGRRATRAAAPARRRRRRRGDPRACGWGPGRGDADPLGRGLRDGVADRPHLAGGATRAAAGEARGVSADLTLNIERTYAAPPDRVFDAW